MKRFLRGKRGQNTAEYAILIALVVAVALGMRTYTQRGLHGRMKDEVDLIAVGTSDTSLGEFRLPAATDTNPQGEAYGQLEPYYRQSVFTTGREEDVTRKFGTDTSLGTATSAERETDESTTRFGEQTDEQW